MFPTIPCVSKVLLVVRTLHRPGFVVEIVVLANRLGWGRRLHTTVVVDTCTSPCLTIAFAPSCAIVIALAAGGRIQRRPGRVPHKADHRVVARGELVDELASARIPDLDSLVLATGDNDYTVVSNLRVLLRRT